MAGSIYEIQDVLLPIFGLVHRPNSLRLDGDAPLPLQLHIVQHLSLHLPTGQQTGMLDDAVRQRGLSMVDVGDDAEVADLTLLHTAAYIDSLVVFRRFHTDILLPAPQTFHVQWRGLISRHPCRSPKRRRILS